MRIMCGTCDCELVVARELAICLGCGASLAIERETKPSPLWLDEPPTIFVEQIGQA